MSNIQDRQTFVFCVNLNGLNPSLIQTPISLRFIADELILKSLAYHNVAANADTDNLVQIWCNITHDGLMTTFPNNLAYVVYPDQHFTIGNNFQTGNLVFQFQKTDVHPNPLDPIYYNPQPLISNTANPVNVTRGILSLTIEFIKYNKKIY